MSGGSLSYNMMKWHNPILALDSLWPVWADTDMSMNVDILTLTPDSLWALQADTSGLFTPATYPTLTVLQI